MTVVVHRLKQPLFSILTIPEKMEAVAAAASVAGILSLTVQGIQAIHTLRGFYNHCTDEAAKDFLHDLSVSARILTDVKYLCEKNKHTESHLGNDIRLATLQVQIEDCTADLQTWVLAATRIDQRTNRLNQNKFFKMVNSKDGTPTRQLVTLINAVYKTSMMVVTKQIRYAVRERFQNHQKNVQIALTILGRCVLPVS
jgi:hypothetical protein